MIGDEVHQFDIGRTAQQPLLHRSYQRAGRGASRTDEDMLPVLDVADRLFGGADLVGVGAQQRIEARQGLGFGRLWRRVRTETRQDAVANA